MKSLNHADKTYEHNFVKKRFEIISFKIGRFALKSFSIVWSENELKSMIQPLWLSGAD